MKRCKNGENCVHPDGPELPIGEYYTQPNGRPYNICKKCHKRGERERAQNPELAKERDGGETAINAVIRRLENYGIGVTRGRASQFSYVDLVAWGFVRIEVKSAMPLSDRKTGWQFNFSPQRRNGIKGDLVVLVPLDDNGDPIMYSVFPPNTPAFYYKGRVKAGVQVLTHTAHRKSGYTILTMQDMEAHEDAWHQVEEVRERISNQLRHGIYNPKRVNKPAEKPLPMFEELSA